MVSIRMLVVSALTALAGSALFAAGCGGGGANGPCHAYCDKQHTCGDIDSVAADQCNNECDADVDIAEASLDKCVNEGDILSAYDECLGRTCFDYKTCLDAVPACKGGGSTGGDGTGGGGGGLGSVACLLESDTDHWCFEFDWTDSCPAGGEVSSCSQSGLLGSCKIPVPSGDLAIEYDYAGGTLTADVAQQYCEDDGGTWTPG